MAILKRICVNDFTTNVVGQYAGMPKEMADSFNLTITQMKGVANAFAAVSRGDFTALPAYEKLGKRSENDEMLPAATKMMKAINALVDDANMLSGAIVEGNLTLRGDVTKFEGRYKELIKGMNEILDAMAKPLGEAMDVLDAMARNDLTTGMTGNYKGEFDNLSQSINSVILTFNQTLSDINNAAEQVASGTHQVSDGAQALSQGATEQASAIEELTASLSEIAGADAAERSKRRAGQRAFRDRQKQCLRRQCTDGRAAEGHDGNQRVFGKHLQDHQGNRRNRIPDQPAGAERRRGSGACRAARQGWFAWLPRKCATLRRGAPTPQRKRRR